MSKVKVRKLPLDHFHDSVSGWIQAVLGGGGVGRELGSLFDFGSYDICVIIVLWFGSAPGFHQSSVSWDPTRSEYNLLRFCWSFVCCVNGCYSEILVTREDVCIG